MPQTTPRIPPLLPDEFTAEQAELVGPWSNLVFSRVLARRPDMYRIFLPFIEKVIADTRLPPRDRQIIVLRTLAAARDTYELHHHKVISVKTGMSEAEIEAAVSGEGLTGFDRTLADAAEELLRDQMITDATWAALAARYSEEQLMEVVFLAGCYVTMAMLTKTFGMPLEDDEENARINALREYT
ncbi:MAG: carboxymuconolactone decarboxylase family protein [Sphingomonadales bacterium]|nr:carboxymuconolactone decarboxylase family protein [Sphingomonadales bacterium]